MHHARRMRGLYGGDVAGIPWVRNDGSVALDAGVWTGATTLDAPTLETCNDWTSTNGLATSSNITTGGDAWFGNAKTLCSTPLQLLCIER